MHAYIESNLNETHVSFSSLLHVSSLRYLHFVSRDEISRDDCAARTNNPDNYTYQKANKELNILHECPCLTLWLMELFGVVFRPCNIA